MQLALCEDFQTYKAQYIYAYQRACIYPLTGLAPNIKVHRGPSWYILCPTSFRNLQRLVVVLQSGLITPMSLNPGQDQVYRYIMLVTRVSVRIYQLRISMLQHPFHVIASFPCYIQIRYVLCNPRTNKPSNSYVYLAAAKICENINKYLRHVSVERYSRQCDALSSVYSLLCT